MNSEKVLFVYNNFYPAWKAGGPVQSLNNLALALSSKIGISVLCSAYDLNENKKLEGITTGKWNQIKGVSAYYIDKNEQGFSSIKDIISQSGCQVLYLNGLYSLPFVVYPLIAWHRYYKEQKKMVLSPRGMLQEGALKVKPLKKKLFLSGLKLLGLHKSIHWHATDVQEETDIKKHFGEEAQVMIAPNIPKKPVSAFETIEKRAGELRLVYLSLITEKKNLHLALQWIKELSLPLTFDIYGPVKDKKYWEECVSIMKNMPENISVNYKGEVIPDMVQDTLSKYHALLLPTKGENFGHAIYEALSVGRPVILGKETPWKNVDEKAAGFAIPVDQPATYKMAIEKLCGMDQAGFDLYCANAHGLALDYWRNNDFEDAYNHLFKY